MSITLIRGPCLQGLCHHLRTTISCSTPHGCLFIVLGVILQTEKSPIPSMAMLHIALPPVVVYMGRHFPLFTHSIVPSSYWHGRPCYHHEETSNPRNGISCSKPNLPTTTNHHNLHYIFWSSGLHIHWYLSCLKTLLSHTVYPPVQ